MIFRRYRRRRMWDRDITDEERRLIDGSLWQWKHLPAADQDRMIRRARLFVTEKHWEGCNGLQITPSMQWAVAAAAALIVPPASEFYFDATETVLLYPTAYLAQVNPPPGSLELGGQYARSGQTVYRGPIILNWQDVEAAADSDNGGDHLAIHELAHQIDFVNGPYADGLPPLPPDVDGEAWRKALGEELEQARRMVERGWRVYLDDYALSEPGEFFAVASECYFQTPRELAEFHPGVFDLLNDFYQFDLRDHLP